MSRPEGLPAAASSGHISWALKDNKHVARLTKVESKGPRRDGRGVCFYERGVRDGLETQERSWVVSGQKLLGSGDR